MFITAADFTLGAPLKHSHDYSLWDVLENIDQRLKIYCGSTRKSSEASSIPLETVRLNKDVSFSRNG